MVHPSSLPLPIAALSPLDSDGGRILLGDDRVMLREGELLERAGRLADSLRAWQGQPMLVETQRGTDALVALCAIWLAGAIAVPVEAGLPERERATLIADARPAATLRSTEAGVVASPLDLDGGVGPRPLPPEIALLLYTSGTTARPKAAQITHANLDAQTRALATAWGLRPGETILHALPLHHLHGLVVALLAPLRAGMKVKMLDRFDATRVWTELGEADVWMAVPTMYQRLLAAYEVAPPEQQAEWRRNAARLRLATSGSAALPTRYAEAWRQLTGAIPLERYGMTEVGIALSNPLDPERRVPGHVGWPLPGVELRRVEAEGEEHPPGSAELWVRGPAVFAGYLDRPEANQAAFVDGWFRTGDLVEAHPGGALRILGRLSTDILKCGGAKLSALEIEEALREHAGVAEVAVVGLPDEALGDRVVAAIVPADPTLTPAALAAWVSERLPREKRPRQIVVVEQLPKNSLGKVQKPALVRHLETFGSGPAKR